MKINDMHYHITDCINPKITILQLLVLIAWTQPRKLDFIGEVDMMLRSVHSSL